MSGFEDFVLLSAREVPLGGPRGMTVRRTLPARQTSLVGAWCFLDHFGPDDVSESGGMQVARHPHTGLSTVSWLFEGAITHRDSIDSHALITPGDVDLMVGGYGITHSEFSTLDTTVLQGIQLWYALPDRSRFREQEFRVHRPEPKDTEAARIRVGLGTLRGADDTGTRLADESSVVTDTALHMAQIDVRAGRSLTLELDAGHEYAVLVDRGTAQLTAYLAAGDRDTTAERSDLMVLPDDCAQVTIRASHGEDLRAMLIGGEPLGEDIVMWWNFIGRNHEEIVAFRARYQAEIGSEGSLEDAPIADVTLERAGVARDAEQFGPFPAHTPDALPAPQMPNGRLRSRGREGRMEAAKA